MGIFKGLRLTPAGNRSVASGSGASNTNNGQIRLELNRDFFCEEHKLNIDLSQTWGTNAPTAFEARRAFSKFELVSSDGVLYSADFHQTYDQARYAETSASPVVAYGAGGGAAAKASFAVDVHHFMDEAFLGVLSGLQTADFSTLSIILTIAAKDQGAFSGGTGTIGEMSATVTVESVEYPGMTGDKASRMAMAWGKARHMFKAMQEKTGTNSASNQEVMLETGNKTRFLFLHSYDTTGAYPVLADGILDKMNLSVKGVDYLQNISCKSIQQGNVHRRGFNVTGVAVIDFGDDPLGWLPLEDVAEVKLKYSTLSTAPATWKVTLAQDMCVGLRTAHEISKNTHSGGLVV